MPRASPGTSGQLGGAWKRAAEIRAFCQAARERTVETTVPAGEAEWLEWAETYAGRLDPLQGTLVAPPAPPAGREVLCELAKVDAYAYPWPFDADGRWFETRRGSWVAAMNCERCPSPRKASTSSGLLMVSRKLQEVTDRLDGLGFATGRRDKALSSFLAELHRRRTELIERARNGTVTGEELEATARILFDERFSRGV